LQPVVLECILPEGRTIAKDTVTVRASKSNPERNPGKPVAGAALTFFDHRSLPF
jgi:hypothetical protein